ncbi:MAG TPA: ATP-binding cassette domain-containing protein [Actinomycetales bacterium]|nr:ATP-binding cassette domain-containing protein [Actinomycetales bacterium]
MITTTEVQKSYGEQLVLDNVTLEVPRGGVVALIGGNGAGKSTLLSVIARLVAADGGTVAVDGLDVTRTDTRELAKRLAILRQENHVTVRLTVHELVSFGRYPHGGGRLTAVDQRAIQQAIEYLDLADVASRHLDELSGGQRQRAFVAMVLAQDTQYVLLDEPLNNLDVRHQAAMMQLLRQTADELGKTVVVVLHDVNVAAAYADHVIALREGRVVAEGPPAEVVTEEMLAEVFGTAVRVVEVEGRRVCLWF